MRLLCGRRCLLHMLRERNSAVGVGAERKRGEGEGEEAERVKICTISWNNQ